MRVNLVPNHLREMNPELKIYSCYDEEFRKFGRTVREVGDRRKPYVTLNDTPIPEEGNIYVASDPVLEKLAMVKNISIRVFGEIPVQAGYCNGRGYTMNALEYHKSPEVNFTTTGCILLLATPDKVFYNKYIYSSDLTAFYINPNIPVCINPGVLHFAPLRTKEEGFRCMVILPKGTNEPLSKMPNPIRDDEEGILWMKNKWLICHRDSHQAEKGAFDGISGRNIQIRI